MNYNKDLLNPDLKFKVITPFLGYISYILNSKSIL